MIYDLYYNLISTKLMWLVLAVLEGAKGVPRKGGRESQLV